MSNKKIEGINKDTFIRLVAAEARFTLGDTRAFWKAVETIFERAIETETPINIGSFGKMYFTHVVITDESKKRWDQINKVWLDPKPYKKLGFKLAKNLKDVLRETLE